MTNSETTSNAREHKQVPVWKNASFWHITILMIACSVFYYMDVIINLGGWVHLKWKIFYTVHDLHRALFLIPAMYAAYEFRLRGIVVTSFLSLLIFLPRALVVSPYPDPLLRALIFMISMVIVGVLLSKLLSNISKSKTLEQNLLQSHSNLLRMKAEEALRESKDNYKSLVDNIPEIIFTIDLEGKITFVSKRTKEILGYESEETVNMNILNFIPEEDRQRAIENLHQGMKGEKITHFQTSMIAKSGDRLFFDCSFSRIYKDGALIGAQGTAVDITERKRSEEALRESERKFRETVVNLDEGYYSITLDGLLLDHNQSFSRILGFDQTADLKGKQIPDFWQNPDERKVYLQEFAANGFIAKYEVDARTKTGKKITVIINAHLVKDKDNLPLRIEGVVLDITERKQTESQRLAALDEIRRLNVELEKKVASRTSELRENQLALLNLVDDLNASTKEIALTNQSLASVNKELAAFSYSVSHDLRAPLLSIDGFSKALLEDCADKLDVAGKKYLGIIRRETKVMGALIDDMLNLSRVTQSEFRQGKIDLSAMARQIAASNQRRKTLPGLQLSIQEGVVAQGDQRLINIAMTNLLDNAWKFTSKQAMPRIEFGMTSKDEEAVYYVRDNGAGFDMAYADKLFGAFQRLHTKAEFEGTGIGLATVQRIIHRHGGKVWAQGEVEKGATFYFTIP